MAEEGFKRKLTAILNADVKGYSRLMGEDERGTVETLKQYRQVIGGLVTDYHGRVIDSPGDKRGGSDRKSTFLGAVYRHPR